METSIADSILKPAIIRETYIGTVTWSTNFFRRTMQWIFRNDFNKKQFKLFRSIKIFKTHKFATYGDGFSNQDLYNATTLRAIFLGEPIPLKN